MSGPVGDAPPKHKFCPTCRRIYAAANNFCPQDQTALQASDDIIAGRYILAGMIGAGATGKVFRAEDTQLGRQVALKLLNPAKDALSRIDREAKAVGALDHDNVVRVYERGQHDDGRMYIAMEFLEGESLRHYLATHGALPMKQALELWLQAVRGVAAAHKKNVVHRDLKPDNLFLARREQDDGTIEQLKVLDFGIAQLHSDRPPVTRGTVRIGTPGYVAPEQWMHGEATARSDVYSLGVILLEMLTGRRNMAANPMAPAEAFERFILQQRLSPALQRLAADVLAPDPGQRPENARVLLDRLRALPESQLWSRGAAGGPRESPAPVDASSSDAQGRRLPRSSEELLPLSADDEDADTEQVGIDSLRPPGAAPAPRPQPEVGLRLTGLDQPTIRVDRMPGMPGLPGLSGLPGVVPTPTPERPTAGLPDRSRSQGVNPPQLPAPVAVVPPVAAPVGLRDQITAPANPDLGIANANHQTDKQPRMEPEDAPLPVQSTLVLLNPAELKTLNLSALALPALTAPPPVEAVEPRSSLPESSQQSPVRKSSGAAATMVSRRSNAATMTNGVAPTLPLGMSGNLWPQQPSAGARLLAFLRSPTALGPVGGVLIVCALLGILASVVIIWFFGSPG